MVLAVGGADGVGSRGGADDVDSGWGWQRVGLMMLAVGWLMVGLMAIVERNDTQWKRQ